MDEDDNSLKSVVDVKEWKCLAYRVYYKQVYLIKKIYIPYVKL